MRSIVMPEPVYSGRGPRSTRLSYHFTDGAFRKKRSAWLFTLHNHVRSHEITNDLLLQGMEPPQLGEAIRDRAIRQVDISSHLEQLPNEQNGISLNWDKRDSAGQPKLKLYYSYSDYEQRGFRHVEKTFAKVAKRMGAEVLTAYDAFPHNHNMGMAHMGVDPKKSVVDKHCRTHDHGNLFLIGSCVFPTGGTSNVTLGIAALAIRAAEQIAKQLRKESGYK